MTKTTDDKGEMIERALRQLAKCYTPFPDWSLFLPGIAQSLAEQAIVIECGVEHGYHVASPKTFLFTSDEEPPYWALNACGTGHHGTPGKAIAIIVSLEEDD